MPKHCPTCTCSDCQQPQKLNAWNKGDSLKDYPGDSQFHTNYSKVEYSNKQQTYYVDPKEKRQQESPTPQPFPTPQQKKTIIDICKRDKSDFEICGVITRDGRVIQLPNTSPKDKRHTFLLDYRKYPNAVAIWHRHLARNGHSGDVSSGDIALAEDSGLSMLMVYDEGIDNMPYEKYTWGEHHPKGIPQIRNTSKASPTQAHQLTPQQKQQIINCCKRTDREEIGGIITSDGRVVELPNLARDKRSHFAFQWNGQDAVAIWHQHCKRLGHSPELSPDDITAANKSGLSMYAVYNPDWTFAEYHPPNLTPRRNYHIRFSCPTAEQIMRTQRQVVNFIAEDNKKFQKTIADAAKEIQAKQKEVMAIATRSLTSTSNVEAKSKAIAARLNFATTQPKLLAPGTGEKADGIIRMGQQPKQRQEVYAGERSNADTGHRHKHHCLPVGRGTPAEIARDRRVIEKSWLD